jgi:hypothetical protein
MIRYRLVVTNAFRNNLLEFFKAGAALPAASQVIFHLSLLFRRKLSVGIAQQQIIAEMTRVGLAVFAVVTRCATHAQPSLASQWRAAGTR